jgi:hypothetical protein
MIGMRHAARFFATSKSFRSGTNWLMSAATGWRKSRRSVSSKVDSIFPSRLSPRGRKKGDGGPSPLVSMRPPIVAAL